MKKDDGKYFYCFIFLDEPKWKKRCSRNFMQSKKMLTKFCEAESYLACIRGPKAPIATLMKVCEASATLKESVRAPIALWGFQTPKQAKAR